MTGVVYGVPYIPPGPPPDLWPGVTMEWHGTDGTVWSLHGARQSGIRMQAGVRGMGVTPGEHTVDQTAGTEGGRWQGFRAGVREVFWPLWVWHDDGSQAWLDYDAAFWASLDPDATGLWVITQPGGRTRSLRCRFVSDGDPSWDAMPGRRGWAPYGVTLQAEDPYWLGSPVVRTFEQAAASPPLFIPEGGGPPFEIAEAVLSFDTATITNPGQVPAWPQWWIGACTAGQYGTADGVIDVPFEIETGRMLVVDTHPTVRTAVEIDAFDSTVDDDAARVQWVADRVPSGTDRTIELGASTTFQPVPKGGSVPLTINVTDPAGDVHVRLEPRYRRAW